MKAHEFDPMDHETPEEDLRALTHLALRASQSCPNRFAVEVGSWAGRSTLRIADSFVTFAVDHWRGNPEDRLGRLADSVGTSLAFETFCKNMGELLMARVIPCRGPSLQWARAWPAHVKLGLIFIDAAHDYQSVFLDICSWQPHLAEGGMICGHDFGVFPGVERAVRNCFGDGFGRAGRSIWYVQT